MYTYIHYTVHIYYVVGMLLTIALVFPVIKILYELLRMSFFAQQKGYPKTEIDIFVIVLHHDGSGESHDGVHMCISIHVLHTLVTCAVCTQPVICHSL